MQVSEAQLADFAKTVELLATKVLEGSHFSTRGGQGLEFHSSRPYSEGEEARFIDWKRYAATDRFFVKHFEREEKTAWAIVLDTSPSMTQEEKWRWVQNFTAALLFISHARGDSWRIVGADCSQLSEAFRLLLEKPLLGSLNKIDFSSLRPGDRVLVISDFMFEGATLKEHLLEYQAEKHRLHLLQVLTKSEKDFGFSEVLEFRDLESSSKLLLDGRVVRKSYLKALEELQHEWTKDLDEESFFMPVCADLTSIEKDLQSFFEHIP